MWAGMTNLVSQLNGGAGFVQAKSVAGQDLPVAFGRKIGEAVREFDFMAINGDRAMRGLLARNGLKRQIGRIDGEKPANVGVFQGKKASLPSGFGDMDLGMLNLAENPDQHIEKVDADVGGKSAGFFLLAFPGVEIPASSRGDVG